MKGYKLKIGKVKNIIMNFITKTQYPQRLHVGKHY